MTMAEATDASALERISATLAVMLAILEERQQSSRELRARAEGVLAAHDERVRAGAAKRSPAAAVDPFPFEAIPSGTTVRDLAQGGRLFAFADGAILRVDGVGEMLAVDAVGAIAPVGPAAGRRVRLPDGKELVVVEEAVRATHEAAGIEGLPADLEPIEVAPGRYSVTFPDGTRLDVAHVARTVTVINPIGTVVVVEPARIFGVGESVEVSFIAPGVRAFRALESGHAGAVESDGTIRLGLANGTDLVIRFPSGDDVSDDGEATLELPRRAVCGRS
jgi:phage baseplate assembly protein gpV